MTPEGAVDLKEEDICRLEMEVGTMIDEGKKTENQVPPGGAVEINEADLDQASGGLLPASPVDLTQGQDAGSPIADNTAGEQPPTFWIFTKRI